MPSILLDLSPISASLIGTRPLTYFPNCSANIGRLGHWAPSSLLLTTRMLTVFFPDHSHSFLPSFSDLGQFYIHNG